MSWEPFVLTNALIPLLQSSAPARIVNVSSGGMYLAKLDLHDLQYERKKYDELMAYAQSKRALMMLTELWAEQLQPSGVTVNCMHPGWVDTPLLQTGLPAFRQSLAIDLAHARRGSRHDRVAGGCAAVGDGYGAFLVRSA